MSESIDIHMRLRQIESQQAIRVCINRYMAICDALDESTPLEELGLLFTSNAIWEGVGEKYASSFGGFRGREKIKEMFSTYMKTPAHFSLNVHFLTSEVIEVDGGQGLGSWMMLQTSTFSDGASHLNAARLRVGFAMEDGVWRIAHFQTENLFSRPTAGWNSSAPLPVPEVD